MIDSPFFERGDEMSISDTVKKVMPYLKTASGYVLHRLSSQAVEMDDGTTLEQKVTSLNSLISNKVAMSDVVNNCLTTEEGFVLDARQGKILDDKITELNGNLPKFSLSATVSTSYTPDVDGFLTINYIPDDASTIILISTTDVDASLTVGTGLSQNGTRVAYVIPVVAGRSYKTDRSIARGRLTCRFMPLH